MDDRRETRRATAGEPDDLVWPPSIDAVDHPADEYPPADRDADASGQVNADDLPPLPPPPPVGAKLFEAPSADDDLPELFSPPPAPSAGAVWAGFADRVAGNEAASQSAFDAPPFDAPSFDAPAIDASGFDARASLRHGGHGFDAGTPETGTPQV